MAGADPLDIVTLQYHTAFPGTDPFNAQEPYVPSSRLLYYGLLDVPYTILDGGTESAYRFNYNTRKLVWKPIRIESLEYAKFSISLYSALINNNTLYINTYVTALANMPSSEYTVHVGVIERRITGETGVNGETEFRNVVKAFLPDAAGITFFRTWNINDIDSVYNFWYLQNVYNPGELKVFAFIQDESTSEVYQAVLNTINLVTGTDDHPANANLLQVYPNPADDEVFMEFPDPVSGSVRVFIYNNLGALAKTVDVPGAAGYKVISTASLPDGIYIIRAVSGTSLLGTQKLNVSH
jgi:hypothetical protein